MIHSAGSGLAKHRERFCASCVKSWWLSGVEAKPLLKATSLEFFAKKLNLKYQYIY